METFKKFIKVAGLFIWALVAVAGLSEILNLKGSVFLAVCGLLLHGAGAYLYWRQFIREDK